MNTETCLKKLQYVGTLAFATVDASGAPQVRNVSAIHYADDGLLSLRLSVEIQIVHAEIQESK